jgi:hypothetical protein
MILNQNPVQLVWTLVKCKIYMGEKGPKNGPGDLEKEQYKGKGEVRLEWDIRTSYRAGCCESDL